MKWTSEKIVAASLPSLNWMPKFQRVIMPPVTMLGAPAAMSASQKIADRPGHDAELLNVTQGGAWCLGRASEEDGEALRAHGGERLVSKL